MHLIYLDESGNTGKDLNNSRQPIHFISGLIIPEDEIDSVSKKVRSLEKQFSEKKIPKFEFHGAHMAMRKGIFEDYDDTIINETFIKLIGIVEKSNVHFISQGIDKQKLQSKYKTPMHPHNLAFMYLSEKIDDFLISKESKGLLIMDNNEDRKQRVINDFSSFKEKTTFFGYGKRKITNIIDSVYYTESYNSPLVQLADVIGYLYAYVEVSKHKGKYAKTQAEKKAIFEKLGKVLAKKTYYSSIKPK